MHQVDTFHQFHSACVDTNSNEITNNSIKYTPYQQPVPYKTNERVGRDNTLPQAIKKGFPWGLRNKKITMPDNMSIQ